MLGCSAGVDDEFINVGRLDNLGMSFCALTALLDTFPGRDSLQGESAVKAVALFDHEEVGSSSAQGDASPWRCQPCAGSLQHRAVWHVAQMWSWRWQWGSPSRTASVCPAL